MAALESTGEVEEEEDDLNVYPVTSGLRIGQLMSKQSCPFGRRLFYPFQAGRERPELITRNDGISNLMNWSLVTH